MAPPIDNSNWNRNNNDNQRPPRYVVVAVKGVDGKFTFEVLVNDFKELRQRQKTAEEDYIQAVKEWRKASADARKTNEKFTDPRPKTPSVEKVGSSYTTRESAKTAAADLQKKYDERLAKIEQQRAEREASKAENDVAGRKEAEKDEKKAGDKKEAE